MPPSVRVKVLAPDKHDLLSRKELQVGHDLREVDAPPQQLEIPHFFCGRKKRGRVGLNIESWSAEQGEALLIFFSRAICIVLFRWHSRKFTWSITLSENVRFGYCSAHAIDRESSMSMNSAMGAVDSFPERNKLKK